MQLFLRVSQYYILRGNVPFPRAGHIYTQPFQGDEEKVISLQDYLCIFSHLNMSFILPNFLPKSFCYDKKNPQTRWNKQTANMSLKSIPIYRWRERSLSAPPDVHGSEQGKTCIYQEHMVRIYPERCPATAVLTFMAASKIFR